MQLKETGAGEVTVRLAETAVTIGGTDEEEAAQRMERKALITTLVTGTHLVTIPTVALSCLPSILGFHSGQQCRQYTKCGCAAPLALAARVNRVCIL